MGLFIKNTVVTLFKKSVFKVKRKFKYPKSFLYWMSSLNLIINMLWLCEPGNAVLTPPSEFDDAPLEPKTFGVLVCKSHITARLKEMYLSAANKKVDKIIYLDDTTRSYYVSNDFKGIRGKGKFQESNKWKEFSYYCHVSYTLSSTLELKEKIFVFRAGFTVK
ncbi:hypothetical protein CDG77_25775 [Nostoc sp. 'Peltigera membranacea cyanobiont' 213]|nr:hypothetical protein CDG77_25775 [Nostoc sp. 'Peltigera membranacea cyanobiont' 213]